MRLIVVTHGNDGKGHEDVAAAALEAGCRAVQFRDKEMCDREFAEAAARLKELCGRRGALFFVNDRVDAAAWVRSDGVHLGVEDLPVAAARELMPVGAIVGYSPEGLDDAGIAVADGADYLGVGPVFATGTKHDAGEPIGVGGLASFCSAGLAPVIAVGGIDARGAAEAMAAGAAGVAVVSAVAGALDREAAVREMLAAVG